MTRAFIWLAFLGIVVFTGGCGSGGGFSQRAKQGGENTLRYPIPDNPTTLDPGIVQDGDTIDVLQQVFEGLVTWGEDNTVQPLLAEKWEVQDGGRTYVFTIKPGVKFHSGREVVAEDFKWSIERNTNPKLASQTTQYLGDIVGLNDRVSGKAQTISGIEVRDSRTLVIRIDKPRPYFLGKLTYLVSAVLDKDKVPADGPITQPEQMVGTGPFRVTEYVPVQLVAMEANKDYHGGAPQLARIERPVIKDPLTRLNKYKGGEVDLVSLERQDVTTLRSDAKFSSHLRTFDRPAIWYVGFNQKGYAPFQDRRVRRAFAMAIDRKKIVDEILGGLNVAAGGIVPPGVPGHRPDAKAIPFDPEAAKRLLAEAGYPGGRGLPPLELSHREARKDIEIVAQAVQAQLKQNLGVDVQIRTMEWGAYLERWNRGELQLFHMRWAADYLDPENFLSYMLATWGPENKIGYANQEFDALCRQADQMMDMAARLPLYAKAEDIALQDAPWVPIYYQRDFELIHPRVSGMRESLFGHLPHTTTRVEAPQP
jgi:ABC-type transport system substrate-binding protein